MAESFDKFWISIDADVSVLQTELIKAQNQLRQFQATLKKSTDVGAITALNTNITFLENKIAHLNRLKNLLLNRAFVFAIILLLPFQDHLCLP